MKTRAITSIFFVAVLLAAVVFSEYSFSAFFFILALLSLDEFNRLVKTATVQPARFPALLLGAAIFFITIFQFLVHPAPELYFLAVPFSTAIFLTELYRKQEQPFHTLGYGFTGIVFVVIPFCFFYASAFLTGEFDFHFPLGFLFLLWANDTGAYVTGMKFGKTRLFERHSPKKSWEGFFGGMIISLLVSFVISLFWTELSAIEWAFFSLLIVVFGTLGDLTESMLKRSLGVKDSGTLLPGHGGLLDRFDGLLLSAPLVFVYLYFILSWR